MTEIQYAPDVGRKFYEDGSVRQFAGNTIICFCDPEGQAYKDAEWVQAEIRKQTWGNKFAMLPPSSFHMTVFELLCDEVRIPEKWSSQLPLDMPLIETDDFFIEAFPTVPTPDSFQMTFEHLNLGTNGLSLKVSPIDDVMNSNIRGYRDQLSEATGLRQPNHDSYVFHISLAYRIIQLADDEEAELEQLAERVNQQLGETFGVFDTGKPMLTFFDDMFAFVPEQDRLTLKSRQG